MNARKKTKFLRKNRNGEIIEMVLSCFKTQTIKFMLGVNIAKRINKIEK